MLKIISSISLTALFLLNGTSAIAESTDLASMSLEQLMNVTVSSVSRRDEKFKDASAAIYVITAQDIAHSNATSLPELLREVPGIHVARIDASNWAISSRGFNGIFNNKMLVMIDGRTVYTPLFGGVFWNVQDTMLEDIERIEVIRGPGSSSWGINAVNGVINIMTKNASQTVGSLITTSISNEGEVISARNGQKIDANSNIRFYGKGRSTESFDTVGYENGDQRQNGFNGYGIGQTGFRYDQKNQNDSTTIQGDWYAGNTQLGSRIPEYTPPFFEDTKETAAVSGGNILARHTLNYSNGSSLEGSVFFDRTNRNDQILKEGVSTYEGSLQYSLAKNDGHQFSFGSGFRLTDLGLTPHTALTIIDPNHTLQNVNAFMQDQYSLTDSLSLTAGLKFEHNDMVGTLWLPTLRSSWDISSTSTIWAAYSRAARVPSVADNEIAIGQGLTQISPTQVVDTQIYPNKSFQSEEMNGYEAGLRMQPLHSVSTDTSLYFNRFSNLQSYEMSSVSFDPAVSPLPFIPFTSMNGGEASVYGLETSLTYDISKTIQLKGWYSLSITHTSDSGDQSGTSVSRNQQLFPVNQAFLKLNYKLSDKWDVSTSARYVDSVAEFSIPSYIAGGAKITYRPVENLDLSLGIENLFAPNHLEYQSDFIKIPRAEIPTLGYLQAKWSF